MPKMLFDYRVWELKKMDKYIRENVSDEESIEWWLTIGVPDNASQEDFEFIAQDDELFNTCNRVFSSLVIEETYGEYDEEEEE